MRYEQLLIKVAHINELYLGYENGNLGIPVDTDILIDLGTNLTVSADEINDVVGGGTPDVSKNQGVLTGDPDARCTMVDDLGNMYSFNSEDPKVQLVGNYGVMMNVAAATYLFETDGPYGAGGQSTANGSAPGGAVVTVVFAVHGIPRLATSDYDVIATSNEYGAPAEIFDRTRDGFKMRFVGPPPVASPWDWDVQIEETQDCRSEAYDPALQHLVLRASDFLVSYYVRPNAVMEWFMYIEGFPPVGPESDPDDLVLHLIGDGAISLVPGQPSPCALNSGGATQVHIIAQDGTNLELDRTSPDNQATTAVAAVTVILVVQDGAGGTPPVCLPPP